VEKLVRVLFEYLEVFERVGFSAFAPEWENRSYLKGKNVTVEIGPERVEGVVRGVDSERGYLLLERRDGRFEQVLSGEVTLRKEG